MLVALSTVFAQKIAVLDFKAGVGIRQSDVDGISAVFTTYFSPRGYTIVERSQIDRILREQGFQGSCFTEIDDVAELGRILNVNKIVVGDVNIVSGQYNVDVRVVDVQAAYITGKDGATFPKGASYRETMKKLAERLASQIAVVTGTVGGASVTNKPAPITLHEYLIVYPEDLGVFSSEPTGIISALNKNKSYGHDDWRLPTDEELAVMNGSKSKLNMKGTDYMTVENCERRGWGADEKNVRLVTLAEDYAYLNLIITVNGTRYLVMPCDADDLPGLTWVTVEDCNKNNAFGFNDWQEPTMKMLYVMYERRKMIGNFHDEKYISKDTEYDAWGPNKTIFMDFSKGTSTTSWSNRYRLRPVRKMD